MTARVLDGVPKVGKEVIVMTKRSDHTDSTCQSLVLGLDAFDENGYPATLESSDHLCDHFCSGGIERLKLRHPENDHRHVLDIGHPGKHPVGSAEEERTVQSKQRDSFIAELAGSWELLTVDPSGASESSQREESGDGYSDSHRDDQVKRDRDQRGDNKHERA